MLGDVSISGWRWLATGLFVGALGCHVQQPPGYAELEASGDTIRIEPTPLKMVGVAPWSWDVSDGRKIGFELENFRRTSGMGLYRLDLEFEVALQNSTQTPTLACSTEPLGDDVPASRFSCWSRDESRSTTFFMAPGNAQCRDRNTAVINTTRTPSCWQGTLRTAAESYSVEFSFMERPKAPVAQIVWRDESGRAVQAADSIAGWNLDLYRDRLAEDEHDVLMLHALAVHQWWHIRGGD